jgi:hypothetical protein
MGYGSNEFNQFNLHRPTRDRIQTATADPAELYVV